MLSFRGSLIAAAASVLLLAVVIGEAGGQTPGNPEPTPAEMAKAIAHVIDAKALKMPDARIAFESATLHDNFVEVCYAAKDARLFSHNKAEGDKRRLGQTGYFCFDRRIQLFRKNGVEIHQVLPAPDDSGPFEFTVDQSTCASLIADVKTRAELTEQQRSQSSTEPKRVPTTTFRSPTAPDSPTESKRVPTTTIRSPTAPDSLTEPKRVPTTTIRSPTAPNSVTEPKRVPTTTIHLPTAPNSLTDP